MICYEIVHSCSQLDKHNSKENNDIPRDKSRRCNAPPDWLKTTIARIVPCLQLAQTEPLLHLTPYSYTFRARSRIFSHTPFFARHYSLPPRTLGWLVGNKSRNKLYKKGKKTRRRTKQKEKGNRNTHTRVVLFLFAEIGSEKVVFTNQLLSNEAMRLLGQSQSSKTKTEVTA